MESILDLEQSVNKREKTVIKRYESLENTSCNTFQVNELPDLKVVVYLPASEETASKLKQLLWHEAVQV